MKVKDSVANEIRLKIQRDKKREYRKRINELKTKENNPPSDSPNSSFSNKAVKSRSLKKVVDALPKVQTNGLKSFKAFLRNLICGLS